MKTKDDKSMWEGYQKSIQKNNDVDPTELAMGIKDEKEEHGRSDEEAEKVARDHLTKVDPKYYSKIKKCGL